MKNNSRNSLYGKVAEENGVSVEEVRREIQAIIDDLITAMILK